jgi:hypothetical protein
MKEWKKKETADAREFGGKLTKGSGNRWYNPSDSKSNKFLIESKQTDKDSYSLNIYKWMKISDEALFSFRLPLLSIKIKNLELVVLSKEDFLKLTKK